MIHFHVGDHTGMHLRDLAAHLLAPDHLAFVAVTLLIGIWAYRCGRRVEARVRVKTDHRS